MSDRDYVSAGGAALLAPASNATLTKRLSCLDDTVIYEFVHGGLRGDDLASADAHVDTCDDCRELVISLAQAMTGHAEPADAPHEAALTRAAAEDAPELGRGSLFGRYVVLRLIGRGAMGAVYLAFDGELNRKVALKLLHTNTDPLRTELTRERLLREAQAMARLSHPNVVAVYEVGSVDDAVFLAMEYVEGETLKEWMSQEHDWREVVDTFTQAARGLQAAHAVDLVHRDFKPANVLVGSDDRVRVTDFGLARDAVQDTDDSDEEHGEQERLVGESAEDRLAVTLTATGSLIGTPAYMAPEQFMGTPADALADQFSFCASLYEALYGKRAFTGASIAELSVNVERAELVKQPRGSSVPTWLHALLVRGLSKDPRDRFDTMTELLAELNRDRGRVRRLSLLALAVIAPVAITVGVLTSRSGNAAKLCTTSGQEMQAVWNQARSNSIETALARADKSYRGRLSTSVTGELAKWSKRWTAMHESTCHATRVDGNQSEALLDTRMICLRRQRDRFDAIATQLSRADKRVAANASAALASLPDVNACADVDSLATVPPPPANKADRVDAVHRNLATARALLVTAQLKKGSDMATRAVANALAIGYKPAIAEARHVLADAQVRSNLAAEATKTAYQALWAAQEARDDRSVANTWLLLVRIAGESARYDRAEHLANHARAAVARIGAPKPLLAQLHASLGLIFYNRGEYAAAKTELDAALALRTELFGDKHPAVAAVLTNLGHIARKRDRYDRSLELHRRAMAINTARFGDNHPRIARHNHNIAGILRLQQKYPDALRHYRLAMKIKTQLLGTSHHEVALTHNSIGLVLLDTGKVAEAKKQFQLALAIFTATKHGQRGIALYNLGLALQRAGEHKRAVYVLADAISVYSKVHGESHPRVARASLVMGESYLAMGKKAAARKAFERVLRGARDSATLRGVIEDARAALAKLDGAAGQKRMGTPRTTPTPAPKPKTTNGPTTTPDTVTRSVTGPPGPTPRLTPPDNKNPQPTPKPRRRGGEYGGGQTWE